MWKRLNTSKGARQPARHGPSPIDTIFDEKSFAVRERDSFSRKQPAERNRAPPRPPRDPMPLKGLPRLPFQPGTPPHAHQNETLGPASSTYSQSSPAPVTADLPRNQYAGNNYSEDEVSPPSSPEFGGTSYIRSQVHANADDEVSPIDEMPDVSALRFGRPPSRPEGTKPPQSSIPVLRREKKRIAAAAAMMNRKENGGRRERQAVDPRWDPYSGEITTSERGKPQSVKPQQFGDGLRSVYGTPLGSETIISAGPAPQTSIGDRFRKLKSQVATDRPEWKGATGRAPSVSPVADWYDIAPLNIPRKSSKRVASPVSAAHSGASTPVTIVRDGDGGTSPISSHHAQYTDDAIMSVLSNNGRDSPQTPIDITPDPQVVNQSAATRSLAQKTKPPTSVQTPPRSHTKQFESPPSTIERNFREALKDSFPTSSDPYVQPPSRFSVTTYAPSEAQSTPPRPSIDSFEPMGQPTPVLNRKRPKVIESPPESKVTRKAVAPSSPIFISMASSNPSRRASNIAKSLPMTPVETASSDLVTSLQAQLEDLAHRRNNITRSIRQVTELMPKDRSLVKEDVRARREIEKVKLERLRNEEADVKREEHEVGLRLHRAWKRRDKDAVFEPTGLWVRRVTGVGRNWAVLKPEIKV